MAGLEIKIGADSSELQAEISAAEAKIKRLGALKVERVKLGLDVKELNSDINQAKQQLSGLKKSVATTGQSFNTMTPQVANGGNALMQFSRIAQDAPYGIIGIGNNLTATAEAFSYLKNQTGSTGGALKALASSLMGSGGILLGISLVTTAFTLFAQSGLSISDVVGKITGDFDALGNSFKTVTEEAKKSAAEQISSLKGLIAIAQDENQSKTRRLEIIDQIQKQYPNYFGNLSTEKIMYGNLTGVVNELTQSLVNKAIAEKFAGTTAESTVKLWKANAQLVKGKEELAKAEADFNLVAKDPSKSQSVQFYASAVDRASERVKNAREEVLKFNKEVERGQNIINMASKKASGVIAEPLTTPKSTKTKAAPKPKKYKNPNPNFNAGNGFIGGGIVNPNLGLVTPDLGVDEAAIAANEKLRLALELQKKTIEDFNKELGSIVTNGTVNALAGIGDAIGGALASGGNVIDAVGKSILGSMGSMLQELGKATIAYGVGLLAVKTAIKNPATAIAAGVAMVALGSMISSSISKSSSSALGGSSGGSGGSVSTGASVSSPTSSTGGGGGSSFQGGTVVFEISGQSLIGVLGNTLDKNKRLGGSLSF